LALLAARVGRFPWLVVVIEKDLATRGHHDHGARREALHFDDAVHLVFFVLTYEQGQAGEQLIENAAQRPHVNRWRVSDAKHDLRGSVVARLDVGVVLGSLVGAGAKIYNLDAHLLRVAQQNILRLEIAVHHIVIPHKVHRHDHLERKSPNNILAQALKVIFLQEVIEVHRQQLEGQHKVLSEREMVNELHDAVLVIWV
jgi:hypothetical protein